MFNLRYEGKLCVPSHDALKDMARHDVPPRLVEVMILDGQDYEDRMMAKGEIGRMVRKDGFIIFAKLVPSCSRWDGEEVWLIKHIGKRRCKR
ncbi:MAG: hypothetical protein R6W91_03600 [Thermoplasmata archaeon]